MRANLTNGEHCPEQSSDDIDNFDCCSPQIDSTSSFSIYYPDRPTNEILDTIIAVPASQINQVDGWIELS